MFNATLGVAEDVNHLPRREFGRDGKTFAEENFFGLFPNNAVCGIGKENLRPFNRITVAGFEIQGAEPSWHCSDSEI